MGTVVSLSKALEDRALRSKRALVEGHLSAGSPGGLQRFQLQALRAQDWAAALRMAQRVLRDAGEARDMAGLAQAHRTLAVLAVRRGEWPTAAMHAVASLELGTRHTAACHLILGLHQVQARESSSLAMHQLRAAFSEAEKAGDAGMQRLALAGLAIHCLVRGHHTVARFFLSHLARLQPAGDPRWRACWLALSAWAASTHGGLQPGLENEAAVMVLCSSDDITSLLAHWALAEHYGDTGQGEAASLCYHQARRRLASWLTNLDRQAPAFDDLLPLSLLSFAVMLGQARMAEVIGAPGQPDSATGGR